MLARLRGAMNAPKPPIAWWNGSQCGETSHTTRHRKPSRGRHKSSRVALLARYPSTALDRAREKGRPRRVARPWIHRGTRTGRVPSARHVLFFPGFFFVFFFVQVTRRPRSRERIFVGRYFPAPRCLRAGIRPRRHTREKDQWTQMLTLDFV